MKYIVTLNGKKYEVDVTETNAVVTGVTQVSTAVAPTVQESVAGTPAPAQTPKKATDGNNVVAPMPGTILEVKASVGTAVKAGDVLLVLEAMKMENDIVAPCDGTVKQILVSKGATVNTDDILAVI